MYVLNFARVFHSRLIKHTLTDIKEDDQTVRFVMFEDRWHFDLGTGAVIDAGAVK